MRTIYELSKIFGFHIIEDASHAIGAEYESKKVGVGKFSNITVFSFHPVKIITSGEGGMAVTNDKNIASKLRVLRSHGITSTPEEMFERPYRDMELSTFNLGFNYQCLIFMLP